MTKSQIAEQSMNLLAKGFMVNYAIIMNGIKSVEPTRTDIFHEISEITRNAVIQGGSTEGITIDRKKVKASLTTEVTDTAAIVIGYAVAEGNEILLTETRLRCAGIERKSMTKILANSQWLYDQVQSRLADLADMGLNAASQIVFKQKIDAFSELNDAPRVRKNEISKATKAIETSFAKLEVLWKKMDLLVGTLRKTNPLFLADYLKAREVIKPSSSKAAGIVTVMMEGTKTPVPNVILTSNLGKHKTGKNGRSIYKTDVNEVVMITAYLPGCELATVPVNFINGETARPIIYLKAA